MNTSVRMVAVLALGFALASCESAAGPAGATGPQGIAGTPGQAGVDGAPGKNGADGSNGADGATGPQGVPGAKGDPGADGNVAAAKGGITGVVTAANGGAPLAGVLVTTLPVALTATTAADGSFALANVAIGSYSLTFSKAGYLSQTLGTVGVVALNQTQLGVALVVDPAAGQPPSLVVQQALLVGYDQPVAIQATVTDPDGDALAVKWQWLQKGGPTVVVTGDKTSALAFKTLPLTATKLVKQQRFGVLGISPDDAGHYQFEVTATDVQGHAAKTTVTVMAAAPNPGLRNAALGLPLYLVGDGGLQKTWQWTLNIDGATGSKATLADAAKQFPHLTLDVKGTYKVTEAISGKTMTLYGGTWIGVMNATEGCVICHNGSLAADQFTPWLKTSHVVGVKQKFDGFKGGTGFGAACLGCHTLGNSPFANNGGFDDVAAVANWQFGTPAPGNWDALMKDKPAVGKLAGVQCESCHGPQGSSAHSAAGLGKDAAAKAEFKTSRVSWSSEVCATCHQALPNQYKPSQWQNSGHADPTLTVNATWEGRGATAAHCGRCHSAQGFAAYATQLKKGNAGLLVKPDGSAADEAYLRSLGMQAATVEPQTCQACHDPHDATNPSQLRLFDSIAALPNGMTGLTGAGEGALCMACHNTRNGEHNDFVKATTSYSGPHAPAQTDVLYGFNAYFMPRYTPSKHLAIADTCATCHVKIPTAGQALAQQSANHSFKPDATVCATCHSKLVTGEPLKAAVTLQLDDLKATIAGQVKALVVAAQLANGKITVRAWQPKLDVYSSAKDPTIDLADAPTSVELTSIHGSFGFILHMPKAVQATWTTGATEAITDVYVGAADLVTKPANGAATKLLAPDSTVAKAVWNYLLLSNDGTKGIHNPTFYQGVIAATKSALLSGK